MVEFLRDDSSRNYMGLTIFQVISALIFLSVVFLWSVISGLKKKTPVQE